MPFLIDIIIFLIQIGPMNQPIFSKSSLLGIIRLIFWGSVWFLGLGLISLFLIRWLSGDSFYPVRLLFYVLPWLLALLIPALIGAALTRRKWLLLTLAFPTIVITVIFAPLFLPRTAWPDLDGGGPLKGGGSLGKLSSEEAPPEGLSIKLVSQNMFYTSDIEAINTLLQQEQPDLLLLQEAHPNVEAISRASLANIYPNLYLDVVNRTQAGFSAAVLSRYPIIWAEATYDKGRTQKVRVETPAGSIEIWNVHPFPPYIYDLERHDRHLIALAEDTLAVEGPLIVAGDFNITIQSARYRSFSRHFRNAHQQAGWGFGFTFPAWPHTKGLPFAPGPLYRIDHILFNKYFVAHQAKTLPANGGSDHLPIAASLMFTPIAAVD